VDFKQNPYVYAINKLLSIGVAFGFAILTIMIRASVKGGKEVVPCATEDYKFIFWMIFVFYSFQALCEMYEAFLAYTQNEQRGVIGFLFELNYFAGIYITMRVVKAVFRSPDCKKTAPLMYEWLLYQTIFFFVCVAATLMICICQCQLQRRVTRRRSTKKEHTDSRRNSHAVFSDKRHSNGGASNGGVSHGRISQ
jgi:hypothetical protein